MSSSGLAVGLAEQTSYAVMGAVRPNQALRLHDVLEREAKRMAQSLHDEAGQLLAAVYLKLDEVSVTLPAAKRDSVAQLKSMLDQLEGGLRRLSHELRPMILDDLGLLPAVEFLRQGMVRRTGLRIEVKGSTNGRLPATLETALYRVVHEALGNISSHGGATRVIVEFLKENGRIHCSIHDDGDSSPGLGAIRERVEDFSGTVEIRSDARQGNELAISIPLHC